MCFKRRLVREINKRRRWKYISLDRNVLCSATSTPIPHNPDPPKTPQHTHPTHTHKPRPASFETQQKGNKSSVFVFDSRGWDDTVCWVLYWPCRLGPLSMAGSPTAPWLDNKLHRNTAEMHSMSRPTAVLQLCRSSPWLGEMAHCQDPEESQAWHKPEAET